MVKRCFSIVMCSLFLTFSLALPQASNTQAEPAFEALQTPCDPETEGCTFLPLMLVPLTPPEAFAKISPTSGATGVSTSPGFSWAASGGAASYDFCYDGSINGDCTGGWTSTGSSTTWSLSGLPNNTTYEWQVRANNVTGIPTYADGGTEWSFTTLAACTLSIPNGNFESGQVSWEEYSTHGWDIIINFGFPPGITPHAGSWAAWLGGDDSDTSYILQAMTVCASATNLQFFKWMQSDEYACAWDFASIRVNTVEIYNTGLCGNDGGWVLQNVSLSAYIGQTVTLEFLVTTDPQNNSNWFLDDISFTDDAAPPFERSLRFFIDPLNAMPRQ